MAGERVFGSWLWLATALVAVTGTARAEELSVGPDQRFARIEEALAAAKAGDVVLVHSPGKGRAYERVALLVRTPRLTIRGVSSKDGERVRLVGAGFDYSGEGRTPRAIVQFDPGAEGCVAEGFDLSGAHNASHNGAGVRINQADHVTVRGCTIRENDMGIMSGGNGRGAGAADQRIEGCLIFSNGAPTEPGYSHNLYLGGVSVVLSACEVRSSTAGHNIKSRAHYTRIEYCWVHDSANREIDLVDAAGETDTPGSDAVLLGNIIVKAPDLAGNRGVIHFGQDGGGEHSGTVFLVNNTIVTPYLSPVVQLSAPGARARFVNNLIVDGGAGQRRQVLVAATGAGGAGPEVGARVSGTANFVSGEFDDAARIGLIGAAGAGGGDRRPVRFKDPAKGDYRVVGPMATGIRGGAGIAGLGLPPAPGRSDDRAGVPLREYVHPQASGARGDDAAPDVGAFTTER